MPFPLVASRQIILRDTVTGAERVLADTGPVTGSAQITAFITADGRYVVYGSVGDFHAFDTTTAATVDFPRIDLGGVSYYPVQWSQDLRFVLYAVYRVVNQEVDRLFVYDRDSATVAEVSLGGKTPVSSPRLSPDARYMSFSSRPAPGIWLLDRLTGDLRSLSPLAEQARVSASAQFTSDSRFAVSLGVAYETASGRAVVRSPTGTMSPNGRYIAYGCSEDARDLQFCVYDQMTTLTSHLPVVAISPPPTSPLKSAVVDDFGRVFFAYSGVEIFSTCGTWFVPPASILYSDLGDTLDLPVTLSAQGPCNWTAQSNVPWLTITSAPSGSGSATVRVVVSANSSGARRIGTLTIAGQTVVVTQGQNPDVPPGAPVALRSPLAGIGSLIWNPPFDGGRVRNYIIEGGSTPGVSNRFRIVSDGSTTSAPIALSQFVNCCGVLFLRVRAANEFGESIASNEVALKLPSPGAGCVYPPDAPEGFAGTVEGSTVRLGWRPPAAPGGQIASYVVEAGSTSGLTNLAHFVTGNTAVGLLAPGVPSGIYFTRVRALNTCGEGPSSNEIVVTVP